MKKYIVILLCFAMLLSLCSCFGNNGAASTSAGEENTEAPQTEATEAEPTDKDSVAYNEEIRDLYRKAVRNEIKVINSLHEMYLREMEYYLHGNLHGTPSQYAFVDMDKDGTEEFILSYDTHPGCYVFLDYYEGKVYGRLYFYMMNEMYDDGAFYWKLEDMVFGFEEGYSQVLFSNGKWEIKDICRVENNNKYFIGEVQVTREEYTEYLANYKRTPIEFIPLDENMLTADEQKAVDIAKTHWRDKLDGFDNLSGYRYRVVCNGKSNAITDSKWYRVSLYRFFYKGYEYLEIATVNIETGEIVASKYPDGKG